MQRCVCVIKIECSCRCFSNCTTEWPLATYLYVCIVLSPFLWFHSVIKPFLCLHLLLYVLWPHVAGRVEGHCCGTPPSCREMKNWFHCKKNMLATYSRRWRHTNFIGSTDPPRYTHTCICVCLCLVFASAILLFAILVFSISDFRWTLFALCLWLSRFPSLSLWTLLRHHMYVQLQFMAISTITTKV